MLDEMPEGTSIVHGDFHTGNTMMSNGELIFIDMGDLGVAEPYSDLAQVYSIFHLDVPHKVVESVSKISDDNRHEFYRLFINHYYNNPSPEVLAEHEKMIRKYLAFRILFFVQNFPSGNSENLPLLKSIIKEFE